MVIAHKKSLADESPLIVAAGDYSDQQFQDSIWGYRDLLQAGLNASLPEKFQGQEVFTVRHGDGGRVEYLLTPQGQAAVIRTAVAGNDQLALFRVTGILNTSRKYADLVTLVGEVMFGDGEVIPGIGKMAVRPAIRAHNRWGEEAGYAEALKELTVGHYYVVTLAGPRREYIARLDLGRNMTQTAKLVSVYFKSIADRDGMVICAQDMDTEPVPTPEGDRNSVQGDRHNPIKGNRFFRPLTNRGIERFQANWDLIMGEVETPSMAADETGFDGPTGDDEDDNPVW